MKKRKLILFFSLLFIFLTCSLLLVSMSRSSIVFKLEGTTLAEEADLILIGLVKEGVSEEIKEEGGIFTFTTLAVQEVIKGPVISEIVIKEMGGTVGRRASMVLGAPRFFKGEKVLVFLRNTGGGFFSVLGLSQGKFSIVKEPASGREMLVQDLSGLHFIGEEPQQQDKIYLEDYLQFLQSLSPK